MPPLGPLVAQSCSRHALRRCSKAPPDPFKKQAFHTPKVQNAFHFNATTELKHCSISITFFSPPHVRLHQRLRRLGPREAHTTSHFPSASFRFNRRVHRATAAIPRQSLKDQVYNRRLFISSSLRRAARPAAIGSAFHHEGAPSPQVFGSEGRSAQRKDDDAAAPHHPSSCRRCCARPCSSTRSHHVRSCAGSAMGCTGTRHWHCGDAGRGHEGAAGAGRGAVAGSQAEDAIM